MGKKVRLTFPWSQPAHHLPSMVNGFPPWIIRGFVRGLLVHICMSSRSNKKLTTQWLSRAEHRLFTLAENFVRTQPGQLPEQQLPDLSEYVSTEVHRILCEIKEHSYVVLNADSDLILPALSRHRLAAKEVLYDRPLFHPFYRPYDEIDRTEQRLAWLSRVMPEMLKALHDHSVCLVPDCVSRRNPPDMPTLDSLRRWAATPHAGALRDNILAHYHNISPARARRLLSNRPH